MSLVGAGAAIDITPSHDGTILGDAIFGNVASGITLQSSTYIGADQAAAKYRNLDFAPFAKMRSGILLTTGNALIARGPNDLEYAGEDNGGPSGTFMNYDGNGAVADLLDVARLDVHFTSDSTQKLYFDFSFGSEEYFEWVNSPYNDTFLSLLDDNPVTLSRDLVDNPITVNNQFFRVDNRPAGWSDTDYVGNHSTPAGLDAGIAELQYDGFTPMLRTTFTVSAGDHVLSFVIGDAGDRIYDSGVFISRALGSGTGDDGTDDDPVPEPVAAVALGLGILAMRTVRRR